MHDARKSIVQSSPSATRALGPAPRAVLRSSRGTATAARALSRRSASGCPDRAILTGAGRRDLSDRSGTPANGSAPARRASPHPKIVTNRVQPVTKVRINGPTVQHAARARGRARPVRDEVQEAVPQRTRALATLVTALVALHCANRSPRPFDLRHDARPNVVSPGVIWNAATQRRRSRDVCHPGVRSLLERVGKWARTRAGALWFEPRWFEPRWSAPRMRGHGRSACGGELR
jgi:hypothetical protein